MKEQKKQEHYELTKLRLTGAILNITATDGLHFASSEFCWFRCFHSILFFVALRCGANLT